MKYIIACLMLLMPALVSSGGAPYDLPQLQQAPTQQLQLDQNEQTALLQREIRRLQNVIIDLRVERDEANQRCMQSVHIHVNWLRTTMQSIQYVEDEIINKNGLTMPEDLAKYKQNIETELLQYGIKQ